jgi:maltose O-acetyltransferase
MNSKLRLLRYDWPLHFILIFTNWLPDNVVFMRLRGRLCKPFFASCGNKITLGRNLVFYNPSKIHIGSEVYIAYGCWICAGVKVTIGSKVSFGPGCVLASGSHKLTNDNFHDEANFENEEILIDDGSWLAANVNVAGGTRIGKASLVAAGCSVKGIYPDKVLLATTKAEIKKYFN